MKKLILSFLLVLISFVGRSQAYIGMTYDSMIADHKWLNGEFSIDSIPGEDGNNVFILNAGYYAVIGNFYHGRCTAYMMILENTELDEAYISLVKQHCIELDKNRWVNERGIEIVFQGYRTFTVKGEEYTGFVYTYRRSIKHYLDQIEKK